MTRHYLSDVNPFSYTENHPATPYSSSELPGICYSERAAGRWSDARHLRTITRFSNAVSWISPEKTGFDRGASYGAVRVQE